MRFTYQSGSNTATNGTALGAAQQDVYVYKVVIGLPVANGNVILYNKSVAYSGDTQNIAFKATLPGTITNSFSYNYPTVYDFGFQAPLQLDGGLLMIDQTMQVTVIWEPVSESTEG